VLSPARFLEPLMLPTPLEQALLATPDMTWPASPLVAGRELRSFIAQAFRGIALAPPRADEVATAGDERLDLAFMALRAVGSVVAAWRDSSVATSEGVAVACSAKWLDRDADTGGDVFAYRIFVLNTRPNRRVTVAGRHWTFEGRDGGRVVVPKFAEGVVGQTPQLGAGQW